jgi:hypothetical protein
MLFSGMDLMLVEIKFVQFNLFLHSDKFRFLVENTLITHAYIDSSMPTFSEMNLLPSQVKMTDIENVELLDKRGYLTIAICLPKDAKVYLRKTEGIREWYMNIRVR